MAGDWLHKSLDKSGPASIPVNVNSRLICTGKKRNAIMIIIPFCTDANSFRGERDPRRWRVGVHAAFYTDVLDAGGFSLIYLPTTTHTKK